MSNKSKIPLFLRIWPLIDFFGILKLLLCRKVFCRVSYFLEFLSAFLNFLFFKFYFVLNSQLIQKNRVGVFVVEADEGTAALAEPIEETGSVRRPIFPNNLVLH
jgi:hypothetical protein